MRCTNLPDRADGISELDAEDAHGSREAELEDGVIADEIWARAKPDGAGRDAAAAAAVAALLHNN